MGMPKIMGLDTDKPYILRADGGKTYTPTRTTSFERQGNGKWDKEKGRMGKDQVLASAERSLEREKQKNQNGGHGTPTPPGRPSERGGGRAPEAGPTGTNGGRGSPGQSQKRGSSGGRGGR